MTQIPHRDQAVLTLTVSELAAGRLPVPLLNGEGAPEQVVLIVDLDTALGLDTADLSAASRECRTFESVVRIGISHSQIAVENFVEDCGEMVDALDVIIVPEASALAQLRSCVGARDVSDALAEITDAVIAHPTAAIFLTQVLRAGERVGLLEAVNIESFAFSTLLGSNEFQFWLSEVRDPKFVAPDHIANPVLIDRAVEELFIVLNRPERRNAYGRQLRDSLADALRVALIDDSVERVHLSGSGRAFSSGGEISEFGQTPDVGRAHFIRTRAGVGHLIAALGDRLTIEVHGACIGAGIEIAAFGAHVVARGSTVFKLPEVGMGLIPGAGGTASISRRIGRHRTAWLALSARTIAQDRAFEWGLVDELV